MVNSITVVHQQQVLLLISHVLCLLFHLWDFGSLPKQQIWEVSLFEQHVHFFVRSLLASFVIDRQDTMLLIHYLLSSQTIRQHCEVQWMDFSVYQVLCWSWTRSGDFQTHRNTEVCSKIWLSCIYRDLQIIFHLLLFTFWERSSRIWIHGSDNILELVKCELVCFC